MIVNGEGNLLNADVDALVNTVNTVGVMGKGIALQFRRAYPTMFREYEKAAKAGDLRLGHMHIWKSETLGHPRYIINFPTKAHWRTRSKLDDIRSGLVDLLRVVRELEIKSIAIPPLGCGNGGLDWDEVKVLVYDAFENLPDVTAVVYGPGSTPRAADMRTETDRPSMTLGRSALIHLLQRYTERTLDASPIEVQKLLYFLQAGGEPLRLDFTKGQYGPYADNLRHVLTLVEGHYLSGYGDGSSRVLDAEPIHVLPHADEAARAVLADHPETQRRIDRTLALAEGFESAYGMELLASVHWVATQEDTGAIADAAVATRLIEKWTTRKQRMFTPTHILTAWNALHEQGWFQESGMKAS